MRYRTFSDSGWQTAEKRGLSKRKCGSLPAKADLEAQQNFYTAVLDPLMQKAREGSIALLFMDASHFVMGCDFPGGIWSRVRRWVKTFSGRKRYNVRGALDYITKKIITVANDTCITAPQVCELLRKIAEAYAGQEIHLVLDNARYQKCRIVFDAAQELGIHLEYIPPYSPNLNLIERLWRHVKKKLSSQYFDDFSKFCRTIDKAVAAGRQTLDTLIRKPHIPGPVRCIDDQVCEECVA